ncbi:uncharacterized protein LOC143633301 [Bidens hawaiensis]|uniref:uncharacterized protein LOC143633301 n=1 Tax=Bidens hawaiensis TaxID=980011 RepID=UPI0040497C7A
MDKTEPTFVPQWLKNTGTTASDEQGSSKSLTNKSLDKDLGRVSLSDRTTTSSYFRRTSVGNGLGSLRSYSSFNRNNRDRFENRHQEYSDPDSDSLGSVLPRRFEKDGLRWSRSSVGKRRESWTRKGASEFTVVSKSSHVNGGGSLLSGNVKRSFEKDFLSLGADEKQVDSDIGRVPPGVSSAINSLPVGNSSMIGGDGWTSALAEVPVIGINNNGNGSSGQPVQPVSVPATSSLTGGRNMAETLAHGPPRTQTTPQLTVETQRLEELAVKQSRQLIPMIPPLPKALVRAFYLPCIFRFL